MIIKPKEYAAPEWTVQDVINDQSNRISRYKSRLDSHKAEIKKLQHVYHAGDLVARMRVNVRVNAIVTQQ